MRAFFLLCILLFVASCAFSQNTALIDFSLKDQFDQAYDQHSFPDKYIILLGADREGSQYTHFWGPLLADSLKNREFIEQVEFVALANLHGVPGIMKKIIKGFFPKEKENWVLLDWEGLFATTYGFAPEQCNILVFDAEKQLVLHEAVTAYDSVTATKILYAIFGK